MEPEPASEWGLRSWGQIERGAVGVNYTWAQVSNNGGTVVARTVPQNNNSDQLIVNMKRCTWNLATLDQIEQDTYQQSVQAGYPVALTDTLWASIMYQWHDTRENYRLQTRAPMGTVYNSAALANPMRCAGYLFGACWHARHPRLVDMAISPDGKFTAIMIAGLSGTAVDDSMIWIYCASPQGSFVSSFRVNAYLIGGVTFVRRGSIIVSNEGLSSAWYMDASGHRHWRVSKNWGRNFDAPGRNEINYTRWHCFVGTTLYSGYALVDKSDPNEPDPPPGLLMLTLESNRFEDVPFDVLFSGVTFKSVQGVLAASGKPRFAVSYFLAKPMVALYEGNFIQTLEGFTMLGISANGEALCARTPAFVYTNVNSAFQLVPYQMHGFYVGPALLYREPCRDEPVRW